MNYMIITDFDETVTDDDTIRILAKIPYEMGTGKDTLPEWSFFSENYMKVYRQYIGTFKRSLPIIDCNGKYKLYDFNILIGNEINYQEQLKSIEMKSIEKVMEYDVFKNITEEQIIEFIKNYEFSNDKTIVNQSFNDFINSIIKRPDQNIEIIILSINWSKEFIYHAINNPHIIKKDNIYCNNLLLTDDGTKYTGKFSCEVLTGSDKLLTLNKIIQNSDPKNNKMKFYVGDSETDLLSILHPNVNGVLMINPKDKQLAQFLKIAKDILNINQDIINSFIHDDECTIIKCFQKGESSEYCIYLAKSWDALYTIIHI